jgi:hypothetical protein
VFGGPRNVEARKSIALFFNLLLGGKRVNGNLATLTERFCPQKQQQSSQTTIWIDIF